jgi:hypothetical protein
MLVVSYWLITIKIHGVDKIMETLRNLRIEFVCVCYIERTSVGSTKCSSSICLHSVVFMSVHSLVTVLSDSPCERIGKWETCPILKEDRSLVHI